MVAASDLVMLDSSLRVLMRSDLVMRVSSELQLNQDDIEFGMECQEVVRGWIWL